MLQNLKGGRFIIKTKKPKKTSKEPSKTEEAPYFNQKQSFGLNSHLMPSPKLNYGVFKVPSRNIQIPISKSTTTLGSMRQSIAANVNLKEKLLKPTPR